MKLMIVIGSVRAGRQADKVANWATKELAKDPELQIDVADLKEVDLPFYNEAGEPDQVHGQYQNPKGTAWAKRVAEAEAFIFLVAEYNHGPTAVLKNAIDWVYDGWGSKPVGFISYGGRAGGTRAVEQLKLITMHVGLTPINLPLFFSQIEQAFDDNGQPVNPKANEGLARLIVQIKKLQRQLKS